MTRVTKQEPLKKSASTVARKDIESLNAWHQEVEIPASHRRKPVPTKENPKGKERKTAKARKEAKEFVLWKKNGTTNLSKKILQKQEPSQCA